MLQYVNSFTCTKNEQSGAVIIHFQQNEPVVSEKENGEWTTDIENHNIASVILEKECIQAFCESLQNLLEENSCDTDEQS